MTTTTINDVNLEAVSELVNKIKESPEMRQPSGRLKLTGTVRFGQTQK